MHFSVGSYLLTQCMGMDMSVEIMYIAAQRTGHANAFGIEPGVRLAAEARDLTVCRDGIVLHAPGMAQCERVSTPKLGTGLLLL
jgi:hypothetical protein